MFLLIILTFKTFLAQKNSYQSSLHIENIYWNQYFVRSFKI